MPLFDSDDSHEDILTKKTILVYLASAFAISIGLGLLSYLPHLSSADTAEDPHARSIVGASSLAFGVITGFLCVLYWYKKGLNVIIKISIILTSVLVLILNWISGYDASMFSFAIVFIDVALALSSYGDSVAMERTASIVMAVCLLAVTIDCIDSSVNLGLHVYGRDCNKYSSFFRWCALMFPVFMNFFLLRRFIRNVREQEQQTVRSVETAFRIAGMLANYDLDSAEKMLCQELRSGMAESINEPLSRLCANLRTYKVFLPEYLFSAGDSVPDLVYYGEPNRTLCKAMYGKEASVMHLMSVVNNLQNPTYTLQDFNDDMVQAFPELDLYLTQVGLTRTTTSGRTICDEYERTLSALYSVYCLLRLELDGKEVFAFGVDANGLPLSAPVGADASKKQSFYDSMPWHAITELLIRAQVLQRGEGIGYALRKDRVVALLTLTAIHDIMKNKALLPYVSQRHAPFRGYSSHEQIGDHDIALEYILVNFPTLLPAFRSLEPGQRAPILFSQAKMGFNNGWLVQGEAPPGALFARFKKVIMEGRTSQSDINFYFVHWLTDLAGAEPFGKRPWPGAEKFTLKFPLKVLCAFLDSFGFVDRLALTSEVQTMEEYLVSRWSRLDCPTSTIPLESEIAIMRLTLMAQDFELEAVKAFCMLPVDDRMILSKELACTGRREHYCRVPASIRSTLSGPAILIYYAPALLQKAGAGHCGEAMRVLASVFRAARTLFPLEESRVEETATIRIDVLKVLEPHQIWSSGPWHLRRTSGLDAEAAPGLGPCDSSVPIALSFCL